jgi:hypothetical protein
MPLTKKQLLKPELKQLLAIGSRVDHGIPARVTPIDWTAMIG